MKVEENLQLPCPDAAKAKDLLVKGGSFHARRMERLMALKKSSKGLISRRFSGFSSRSRIDTGRVHRTFQQKDVT